MKKTLLYVTLFFIVGSVTAQVKYNIAGGELARLHAKNAGADYIKEPILVGNEVLYFERKEPNLKEWCILSEELSKAEADEIFGIDNDLFAAQPDDKKQWDKKDFGAM